MNTSKTKKGLSVLLAIIMLLSTLSTAFTTLAAEKVYPVMEKFTAASSAEFHAYYGSIYSATFLDRIDWDDINASYQHWDSSENNDNSVIAYIKLNAEQTELAGTNRYDLYIAGDGGVGANPDSGFIFYFFSALEEVRGCENFKTSNTTSFNGMFYECKKLRSVTGIDWDTSNVTDMSYMFRNCHELTELDLSSFDTSKVTTMKYMFYYCEKLEHIYVGDGWTTEAIANLNDGVFNCCYAIVGGKEIYNENFQYFPPSAEYAKLKEDGGFLTYKLPDVPETYTVTYEFIGDVIPENVTAPEQAIYDEGTSVTVATDASAEGYIFSGWSTDDAEIEDGKFTLNNNVHFVGSWEKLYKVEYRYTEGYAVPEGAPALPAAVYYKAGDDVDVFGIPYVDRHLFIGWTTSDADIFGDMFTMPENDVIIYGYFKIP
ncbi:MAG: BspA family leucine-rich repeat surface protein, partial [Clostridia bacterium]|nr:BspA family leucine-rich repeat surface protein [Clostridia bacterium]